ncbi:hypothetical protein AgCh_040320 [Apium graveolens]
MEFSEADVNMALGILTENLIEVPTQDELAEFMDFINYNERINLASLNKKNLRKKCSETGILHGSQQTHQCGDANSAGAQHKANYAFYLQENLWKPTTSSSQKVEVSKKKRKQTPLAVINESGEVQTEHESPLVKKTKKEKQTELTTQATSTPSQQDTVVNQEIKQTIEASSQQGVSIEQSIHPNAPCKEFAPTHEKIQVYERRNKDGTHKESTSFETPSSTQGELPTLNSEIQHLISQISSSTNQTLESDSQELPTSSDMVQETVLTTQDQNLVVERLHAGVHLDDTNTNTGISSIFTEDPVVVPNAPSCPNQPSHIEQLPLAGTTPSKTLAEIALTIKGRSSIANDFGLGEAINNEDNAPKKMNISEGLPRRVICREPHFHHLQLLSPLMPGQRQPRALSAGQNQNSGMLDYTWDQLTSMSQQAAQATDDPLLIGQQAAQAADHQSRSSRGPVL